MLDKTLNYILDTDDLDLLVSKIIDHHELDVLIDKSISYFPLSLFIKFRKIRLVKIVSLMILISLVGIIYFFTNSNMLITIMILPVMTIFIFVVLKQAILESLVNQRELLSTDEVKVIRDLEFRNMFKDMIKNKLDSINKIKDKRERFRQLLILKEIESKC